MPCVKQKYFSIGSLSILWSHDLYSESKVQATTVSLWQIKNTENLKEKKCSCKSAEGSLACQKSNLMWKDDHQSGPFPLNQKSLFGRALSKRRGNETKPKQNRRLLKTLSQGQLSMECILVFKLPTRAEHQKLGWVSPLFSQAQATVSHCGLSWIVTHSVSAGCINTNTGWSNRKGCQGFGFVF